ncbi:hypothetical protein [Kitasatospora sp. NPDC050463]|uniref:hypothetical protein n=1 Tax=Kitasatospora sp. NPDC050463 TaxID=3155786 RepID=UPI0033FC7D91
MSYTDEDVREGRRLMNEGRTNRLAVGDQLVAVTGLDDGRLFEEYCSCISLAPRTGRDYRHTARIATPAIRQLVAESTVHVSYSALREGARLGAGGVAADEGWNKLRTLLKEAERDGWDRISVIRYQQVLGVGPALRDLLEGATGGDDKSAEILRALQQSPQKDQILRAMVEDEAQIGNGLKRAWEDKRRRDRERDAGLGPGGDSPRRDKGYALSSDLIRLRDQSVALMNRYPRAVDLDQAQRAACEEAIGTLEVLVVWAKDKAGVKARAVRRPRTVQRETVGV